ncbi:oxidoreductase [Actinopolymorpha pittospori]|uniref:NAD(P)-dependent dehydrogenase (Short-subunit alcohol dehydrogenase family) n=1 Tax=Actinopolymorpha pittospori TaxID=648752 RepID=A0A927NBQ0_9ACTN|nr:oxidoreductase [Actinopolymorpha pittospori]MBE1612582.1 NAD(P)-dependent dehydrogenase (short-subunit alcohol dehydrogenase family) [Actinopolymorpha pittospori]
MARTWVITGSSRGFGREIAKAALDRGNRVVATARRPEQLADLEREYGDQVLAVALDVTDTDAIQAAIRQAVERFGTLDVLVNNAGNGASGAIEETSEDEFRAQIEANLFGVINVTKAALPIMRRQRGGHFIQFSTFGARVGGTPGMGAYQTAKWGVEGFSEVLHNEVKPFGVKVTIIEPGAFRTDWAGTCLAQAHAGADYDQTGGATNRSWEANLGEWPGDPAKAARIIADIVELEEPPLRLLLGAGAVESTAKATNERAAGAREWAPVSRFADFGTDETPDVHALLGAR